MRKKQKIFINAFSPSLRAKRGLPEWKAGVVACTVLLAIIVFCGHASADPAKYKPNSTWDLSYVLPPSPGTGDLYSFIGVGQPSLVKPGSAGLVLKSRGSGQMPGWEAESASVDWTSPGTIGSGTPNTGVFSSLKAWGVETLINGGTSSGTNTITVTPSPAVGALATGQMVAFKAGGTNTSTAPTFSPSSLTAQTIVREGGIALQPGDIFAGGSYILRYDGTNWILLNPSTPKMFNGYATRAGDAASGSQAITGVGFKPKYILLHASFVSGYSSFSISTVVNGVAGLGNVQLWTGEINPDNTKIVNLMQSSGNQQSAVLASIDSDGFTLTWTKTGSPASTTMYISYTCIG